MAEFSGDPTNKNTFDTLESNNPGSSRQAKEETSPSKNSRSEQYDIIKKELLEWITKQITLKQNVPVAMFKNKAQKFIEQKNLSESDETRDSWIKKFITENFQKVPESWNWSKDISVKRKIEAEQFIQKLDQQRKRENISEDNIYSMVKVSFNWKIVVDRKKANTKTHINIDKFRNDKLIGIFCINATGSNKLPPYFIYQYENEETVRYLDNKYHNKILKSKINLSEKREMFKLWYKDFFMERVDEHQRKAGKNDKVILLLKKCKEFLPLKDIRRNPFKIVFFPSSSINVFQPITYEVNKSLYYMFETDVRYNAGFGLNSICECWATMLFKYFSWNKIIKDKPRSEENTPSTSFDQTSELHINVTEEDTAIEGLNEPTKKSRRE
ncbi:jerky protein-like [Anoplolepis gracilipes]|uniref:jerky protein-like n=1 Tax=Anoplolepis gracilipes TaxID=354296 RepID=UPI003BA2AEF7